MDSIELATLYTKGVIEKAGSMMIRHTGNNKIYRLTDKCKVQINGEWVDGYVYCNSSETYCRASTDFKKFEYECHNVTVRPNCKSSY